MRPTLTFLGCLIAFALAAQCALAHGGNYAGPSGGGTPGYRGPAGGGTTGPSPGNPNPGGGTTPGAGGGTPGPGGGTTGPAPLRPGGRGAAAGGTSRGGTTPGGRAKSQSDGSLDWDLWWELNDDRFLNLKVKVRSIEAASTNHDTFVGEIEGGDSAGVTTAAIRKHILPALTLALKDPYYDARAGAVIALGKVGDASKPEVMKDIMKLLADQDRQVRESACLALGLFGSKDAVPDLLEILKNTQKGRTLTGQGTGDVDERVRSFAAVGIGLIGNRQPFTPEDKVIPELVAIAKTKNANADVPVGAAIALQLIKSPEAVPAMIEMYKDADLDRWVRAHVGVGLGKVGAKQAIPVLVAGLKDKETFASHSAAIALGLLVTREENEIVNELYKFAKGAADRGTRNFCLIALGEIGNPRGKALLLENISRGQFADQSFSALALGIMGSKFPEEAAEAGKLMLEQYTKERSDQAKSALAIGLGLLDYQPAAEVLRQDLAGKGVQTFKGHLCTALGLLNDREAIPAIQEHVKQKGDQDLRKAAAISLGLLRDSSAVQLLHKVIQESTNSKAILGAATVALGFVGDIAAVDILKVMVENAKGDQQDVTRAFATVALGHLGDKDDIPLLSKIHAHSNYLAQSDAVAELLTIL